MTNDDEIGRIRRMTTIKNIPYFFEIFLPVDIARNITKKELSEEKLISEIIKEKNRIEDLQRRNVFTGGSG